MRFTDVDGLNAIKGREIGEILPVVHLKTMSDNTYYVQSTCSRSLEMSGSRSLEMSCSRDGPDKNEHQRFKAYRGSDTKSVPVVSTAQNMRYPAMRLQWVNR